MSPYHAVISGKVSKVQEEEGISGTDGFRSKTYVVKELWYTVAVEKEDIVNVIKPLQIKEGDYRLEADFIVMSEQDKHIQVGDERKVALTNYIKKDVLIQLGDKYDDMRYTYDKWYRKYMIKRTAYVKDGKVFVKLLPYGHQIPIEVVLNQDDPLGLRLSGQIVE